MAELKTACGAVVLLDDAHLPEMAGYRWRLNKKGYAEWKSKGKSLLMHRLIAGAKPGQIVDHIDQNKTNNCSSNLRLASPKVNTINQGKRSVPATSEFKGVSWATSRRKWRAQIGGDGNGKQNHLGMFESEQEAAHAYNKAAIARFGEFAVLNPIGQDKEISA